MREHASPTCITMVGGLVLGQGKEAGRKHAASLGCFVA